MKQTIKQILVTVLAAAFLLSACAPSQAATPNAAEVENLVSTAVALTVESQNLETAQAIPPATETPLPTAVPAVLDTPTAVLPTATPFVIVPPTTAPVGGGGVTTTRPEYQCDIIHQRPYDYSVFRPNDPFDIKWTIVNTGTRTMHAGLDVKYNQGPQLTGTTLIELPELDPGEQFPIILDAVAPDREGTYIMTFIVEGGLCYPYVAIKVE